MVRFSPKKKKKKKKKDPIQLERTGAFVMYASAVSLVEESHAEKVNFVY